ncbi:hypothetical protein HMI54_004357 [Coelomomyces lativittatus]|nr:hypothetical protein HMI56_003061 [Coelomomyces lativittatus]KAJ1516793.1 hypothetical protein HMI55_001389 [Coelomomyces lativittatus]KAJ1517737.1 hypothetical protein HMI54_004357 [Coelomomyces lativittatus]
MHAELNLLSFTELHQQALTELTSLLPQLQSHVPPTLLHPLPTYLSSLDTPLEQAKASVSYTLALYTAVFVYLKCHGIDPDTSTLDRLKQYFAKCQQAELWLQRNTVHKSAAQRMVKAALGKHSSHSPTEHKNQKK